MKRFSASTDFAACDGSPAPRSLYIHVPFCLNKCGYCDFYSIAGVDEDLMRRYVRAVGLEGRLVMPDGPAGWRTVYIGGGTPSALPAALLGELLEVVCGLHGGAELAEFTVEANPGSLDGEKALDLRRMGVNRLSLGVQSLDERTLAVLGRLCGAQTSRETVLTARRAGFDNISIDLMFGVPGQTVEQWRVDIEAALSLESEHLSVYGLSIEPETPLGRAAVSGAVAAVDEGVYVEMMFEARERLRRAGYEHYEISNYALPGRHSEHNLTYWHNEPYVGLGAAAASYVGGVRRKNVSDVEAYCGGLESGGTVVCEREQLDVEMTARETAMLGLRLTAGLDLASFRRRTGYEALELFRDAISRHRPAGLLEVDERRIRLSERALAVSDSVLADFVTGDK